MTDTPELPDDESDDNDDDTGYNTHEQTKDDNMP